MKERGSFGLAWNSWASPGLGFRDGIGAGNEFFGFMGLALVLLGRGSGVCRVHRVCKAYRVCGQLRFIVWFMGGLSSLIEGLGVWGLAFAVCLILETHVPAPAWLPLHPATGV